MTETPEARPFRRVVVAFDASPQGRALLERAGEIARCFEASLAGLFIEQEGMMDYAGLPFAHEVTLTSATLRPLSPERMAAHCHAQLRLARRLMETMASRHRLLCDFTTHRGSPGRALSEISGPADLVLISPRVGFLARPSPSDLWGCLLSGTASGAIALSRPSLGLRAGPVVALLDRELTRAEAILSVARAVLRLPGVGDGLAVQVGERPDAGAVERIAALAQCGAPFGFRSAASREALKDLLAAARPALLVLSAELEAATRDALIEQGHSLLVVGRDETR